MMNGKKVYIVRLAEAFLKGNNKPFFEGKIISELKRVLGASVKIYRLSGLIIAEQNSTKVEDGINSISGTNGTNNNAIEVLEKVKRIFGIATISPAYQFSFQKNMTPEKILADIADKIFENFPDTFSITSDENLTFKINTKRRDKAFPLKSPEINKEMGRLLLLKNESLKVDIHNPSKIINVEIREDSFFIYDEILEGSKGLPKGTSGHGISLLSGGIDSPVSTYLMAKRGMKITAIHFHSYPYTSERAKEKVKDLVSILSEYLGKFELHVVNILAYQEQIRKFINPENMTIHTRRAMMKLADMLAEEKNADALINGESLGQVASQTAEAIKVTDEIANRPVFRPLIAMEKTEIIGIARKIGTFETSIQPYEDCCQVFLPKHPNTKPKLSAISKEEGQINRDEILTKLFEEREVYGPAKSR